MTQVTELTMSGIANRRMLRQTLDHTFGLTQFREGQEHVIESVLAGNNTLAVMPTGAGKSLCYQLAGVLIEGLTLVVSPLIALMKDQTEKMLDAGFDAAQLNSSIKQSLQADTLQDIAEERGEFIFATPERLTDPDFLALLKERSVSLLVVDEAHCISQWGHDFRPAFLQIGRAIEVLGHPRVLALTATATERVIDDICKQLSPRGMNLVRTNLYRENLDYEVIHITNEDDRVDSARRVIAETPGAGIIYTATVKAAEELHDTLIMQQVDCVIYHGRLSATERTTNQERFMSGECRIMIATNAFGMGIDKPDIRFVLHYQMPGSLESYYQESGRAGRDGERSRCVLLYNLSDARIHRFFLSGRYPDLDEVTQVYDALRKLSLVQARSTQKEMQQTLDGRMRVAKLQVALRLLNTNKIVSQDSKGRYQLLKADVSEDEFEPLVVTYRERAEHDQSVLLQMEAYAQTCDCRWLPLLTYFHAEAEMARQQQRCGHCDNCLRAAELAQRLAAPVVEPLATPEPIVMSAAPIVPPHAVGDAVRVAKYGRGKVVAQAGDIVTVQFPDGSSRDFHGDFVKSAQGRRRNAPAPLDALSATLDVG